MGVLIASGTNVAYFYSVYSVLRTTSPHFKGIDFLETSLMFSSIILQINVTNKEDIDNQLIQKNDVIKISTRAKFDSDGFVI
ncbi:hypothetical protein PanWU01x14_135220 [Parasponia andersonii]|uniref:Uncharacterized protein n=1 Tax=Parasponia andersonii TaxID=3476 RepID=A0A2P5CP94_PARAD|nr:hypothetical protein PanWU01x14_135220 [Parasponia andersonii]